MINKPSPFRSPQPVLPLRDNRPLGFLPSIKQQFAQLMQDVTGIKARLGTRLGDGEPAGAVGQRVFVPEAQSFLLDVAGDGSADVAVQYVVRDGQTYDVPIIFPPPGVFRARYLNVAMYQRVYATTSRLTLQVPVAPNGVAVPNVPGASHLSTLKWGYPAVDGAGLRTEMVPARLNFVWNMIDNKSGNRLSDQFLPDTLLLPQAGGTLPFIFSTFPDDGPINQGASGGCFEFDLDWLFERDADITFQFRPIHPMLQPTVATGAIWNQGAGTFDDREFGGAVRNNSLTVKVELHGTRHYTEQDAKRIGALSKDD